MLQHVIYTIRPYIYIYLAICTCVYIYIYIYNMAYVYYSVTQRIIVHMWLLICLHIRNMSSASRRMIAVLSAYQVRNVG